VYGANSFDTGSPLGLPVEYPLGAFDELDDSLADLDDLVDLLADLDDLVEFAS